MYGSSTRTIKRNLICVQKFDPVKQFTQKRFYKIKNNEPNKKQGKKFFPQRKYKQMFIKCVFLKFVHL